MGIQGEEIVVVGDIHGDIETTLRIFERFGYPPQKTYLFLGDYVDRGQNSVDVLLLLYSLKLLYSKSIYLIRGNHESHQQASVYGFQDECVKKYDKSIYHQFLHSFLVLPLCAVVNSAHICMHGGLSEYLTSLDQIRAISRPIAESDVPYVIDMLWSDPNPNVEYYGKNERHIGNCFGPKSLSAFLEKNRLKGLIRGHQFCRMGFSYPFDSNGKCITIFSSANYCQKMNNASIARVDAEGGISLEVIPPLSTDIKNRRRPILPEWLMNHDACKSNKVEVDLLHIIHETNIDLTKLL